MVHLHKDRIPVGTYNKLKKKKIGPCCILQRINGNAYIVDLPPGLAISSTFNVVDLTEYHSPETPLYFVVHSWTSPFQLGKGRLMQHGIAWQET
ncbi:hypothetical protein Patl1_35523 [Pistacia atlantica]|nr:hypothetical protein Patl1_35523 [Pistacia atlantica]